MTNLEMHISRGLPGSGKTSMLSAMAIMNGGRLVGRDHIRPLVGITGAVGTPAQEREVTALQDRLIVHAFRAGQNVYVDDMNLRNRYVSRLWGIANKFDAKFIVHDLTNVSEDECQRRNAVRAGQGGRAVKVSVIEDLHYRFVRGQSYPLSMPDSPRLPKELPPDPYVPDESKPKAILVDLDGTLALHDGIRGHHDYDRVSEDLPNWPVIAMVQGMTNRGYVALFVSGRPDSCLPDTRMWLNKYVNCRGSIYMRKTGDKRADFIVKNEIFNERIRDNFNVVAAIDDRDQVVDMYREMGIPVFQVAPGNF